MNIEYSNAHSFRRDNSPTFFILRDPFWQQREYERELRLRDGSEHDPERPPKWKPGDKYTVIGTVVGLIVGGVSGAIGGGRYIGGMGIIIGLIGGVIAGGIIGAVIGDLIRKRREKTKTNAQKPLLNR